MRCHRISKKLGTHQGGFHASELGLTEVKLCDSGSAYITVGFGPARGQVQADRFKGSCKTIRVSDHAAHSKLSKSTWQVRTDVSSDVKKCIFSLGMICELKRKLR